MKNMIRKFLWPWQKPKTPCLSSADFNLSDSDLCDKAMELVCDALKAVGGERQKVPFLSPPWRLIYLIMYMEREVANGGFHQLFTNAGGIFDKHFMEDMTQFPDGEFKELFVRAFMLYQKIDYTDQWENRGKSWDYFVAPYKEGRFQEEDKDFQRLFAAYTAVPSLLGSHIRKNRSVYQNA